MIIGRLRKKVTIQKPTFAGNADGEPVATWADHAANRWAEVDPRAGVERSLREKIAGTESVLFRLRYVSGITSEMKLVYDGNDYDIVSIVNVGERNRELLIQCKRVT